MITAIEAAQIAENGSTANALKAHLSGIIKLAASHGKTACVVCVYGMDKDLCGEILKELVNAGFGAAYAYEESAFYINWQNAKTPSDRIEKLTLYDFPKSSKNDTLPKD